MPRFRISEAATLLGVSDDTVRRWVDAGQLEAGRDGSGRLVVEGRVLAAKAVEMSRGPDGGGRRSSARNRLPGLVTSVQVDGLVAQVDIQCGPFAVTSLITRDAAEELQLEVGSRAVAVIKATTVIVESPHP